MNPFTAKELMATFIEAHNALQSAEEIAKKIEEKDEYLELMKKLLNAIGELEDGPMLHVIEQHPSISPFQERGN